MSKRIKAETRNGYIIAREGNKYIIVTDMNAPAIGWSGTYSGILLVLTDILYAE